MYHTKRVSQIDVIGFYDELSSFANYGPMYRRLRKFWVTTNPGGAMDALGEIRGAGNDIPRSDTAHDFVTRNSLMIISQC